MNSLDNLDEETSTMISIQTFLVVNLIYISGFSIYKFYKNYQCNKLQKTNTDLLEDNNELVKAVEDKSKDNEYLVSILKEGENLLKTHTDIKELYEENTILKQDCNTLEEVR